MSSLQVIGIKQSVQFTFSASAQIALSTDINDTITPASTVLPDQAPLSMSPPSSAARRPTDVSALAQKAKSGLCDLDRVSLLTEYFIPPPSWKGPFREIGQTARRAPSVLFDRVHYPYVSYSPVDDGAYCAACVGFSNKGDSTVLVSRPLVDWSNAKRMLDSHEMAVSHRTAVARAQEFLKVHGQQHGSAWQQLSKAYNDKVEKTKLLWSLLCRLCYCAVGKTFPFTESQ
jgi:hypothetical protein